MATQSDLQRGFKINAAMSAFLRVVVDTSGLVGPATFNQLGIGVLQNDVSSTTYDIAVVRLWGAGTFKMTATGLSMTAGNVVHALTSGYFGIDPCPLVAPISNDLRFLLLGKACIGELLVFFVLQQGNLSVIGIGDSLGFGFVGAGGEVA